MLNSLWCALVLGSVACALGCGRVGQLSAAMMDGARQAVELSLFLLGTMCVWLGFLKIAGESGLTGLLSRAMAPAIRRLFPEYRDDGEIQGKICLNLSANLLGLGNAATPLGLAAMKAMARKNQDAAAPTPGMVLFVVMNTASLQLLPVNMAAMRQSCGSAQPFGILPQVWMASGAALATCVLCCKLWERSPLWNR